MYFAPMPGMGVFFSVSAKFATISPDRRIFPKDDKPGILFLFFIQGMMEWSQAVSGKSGTDREADRDFHLDG